jgi:ABC-type multidrug transport system ATPase subunit
MSIQLHEISKAFDGKPVLEHFSASFPSPGLTAVMGSSGAGKTTLIRILLGLTAPDAGSITGLSEHTVSVVFQENRLFPELTALQNAEAAGTDGGSGSYWLERLGLGDVLSAYPDALSGGMQRRVALARALCYGGSLLILDEPFKGLDIVTRSSVMDIFRELKQQKTILLITHDPEEARILAEQTVTVGAPGR